MKTKTLAMIVLFAFLLAVPAAAVAKTQIVWWHAMGGYLGEKVKRDSNQV
jgi:uncharacterized membrane protein YdcZ (DUF606 family)